MTIGDRIKDLRLKAGISQVNFAEKIKVSKQTLYKYEHDIITNIPSDKIEAMARILNTTPSYLMGWSPDKYEELNLFEYALSTLGWAYNSFSECTYCASKDPSFKCDYDEMGTQCANCKYLLTYYYLEIGDKYYKLTESEFNSLSQCILPYLRFRTNEILLGKTGLSEKEFQFKEYAIENPEEYVEF